MRLRNARPLDKKRAKISAAHVDNWFTEYKQFMIETRLDTRLSQIWNCDETGFDLQGKAGKVLGPSEPKDQPYRVITGTKEHVTVLPCFSAAGQWIAPYFLLRRKARPHYLQSSGGRSSWKRILNHSKGIHGCRFILHVACQPLYTKYSTRQASGPPG